MINLITLWVIVSIVSTICVVAAVLTAPRIEDEVEDLFDQSTPERPDHGNEPASGTRTGNSKRGPQAEIRSIHSVKPVPRNRRTRTGSEIRLSNFNIIRSEKPHS